VSGAVALAVLFAALLHASWNASVKGGTDLGLGLGLVALGSAAMALCVLPWCPAPLPASWPFLGASAALQVVYFRSLLATYRQGDISFAYPLMRGTAPLLVALASLPLAHERLRAGQWLAIAAICGGILYLCLDERRRHAPSGRTLPYALLTACLIASYTLVDGIGVRRAGAALGYTMWMFVLTGTGYGLTIARRHAALLAYARTHPRALLIGGVGSLGSYGIALWAMTRAPVATVAALRETSILFATAIAGVVLRERIGRPRLLAVTIIACGAVAMRLA
jgi:drug/metabolite transporter (DMT)-like permease